MVELSLKARHLLHLLRDCAEVYQRRDAPVAPRRALRNFVGWASGVDRSGAACAPLLSAHIHPCANGLTKGVQTERQDFFGHLQMDPLVAAAFEQTRQHLARRRLVGYSYKIITGDGY